MVVVFVVLMVFFARIVAILFRKMCNGSVFYERIGIFCAVLENMHCIIL